MNLLVHHRQIKYTNTNMLLFRWFYTLNDSAKKILITYFEWETILGNKMHIFGKMQTIRYRKREKDLLIVSINKLELQSITITFKDS